MSADRHTVFWNSTNPRFHTDDYTAEVRLNDYLDIICPHYEEGTSSIQDPERYTLFMVEHEEYLNCKPISKDQVRWECNKPFAPHGPEKFSEKFQRFTPFTLGKEFKEGHSYYYISKPIHHHGEKCLKLRVAVLSKTGPGSHSNVHTSRPRLQSDYPSDGQPDTLKSVGSSASSVSTLSITVILLSLLAVISQGFPV